MLHACNAVDGVAGKVYDELGNKARFTRLLRDNYDILGPMDAPGIDLARTRWPVRVMKPTAVGGQPDLADVIYGIHRCCHSHGDELPDGFELIPDARGPIRLTQVLVGERKVRLSDRILFGLIAVVVTDPSSVGQSVPVDYHLTFEDQVLPIADWWGRADDLKELVRQVAMPQVVLDFGDWMDNDET